MLRLLLPFLILALSLRAAAPELMIVTIGDQHSAYEKLPQLVARIDRLKAENPGVPLAILIDGDSFEYGNALGRRTGGALDFAFFSAAVKRAPTVLTLGNHEPDLFGVADVIGRVQATGVTVISGNARSRATGQPFAPASAHLKLGSHELTIVGVTTDSLSTFRVAVRPDLDLADPAVWAKQHFATEFSGADIPIVLSHSGVRADRQMFSLVPKGTLFIGAHDHLLFVHRDDRLVYLHSGSWLDHVSIATLSRRDGALAWEVRQEPIADDAPSDPELADAVREVSARSLTAEEKTIVGQTTVGFSPSEAARFAVESARRAAGTDVAVIGGTTFGGGLPAGNVTRYAFDACVRFDGTLYTGQVSGARLKQLLSRANQGPNTLFAERAGENLVATGIAVADIDPAKEYTLATSDWIARNPAKYLGENPPALHELPTVKLKAAVLQALSNR